MSVLVTGAAGFVGMHVCQALLARGRRVIGIDNMNAYYDPALKRARLRELAGRDGFAFEQLDIADARAMEALAEAHGQDCTHVVHLAAQAGVRHSLDRPFDYVRSNLEGHMVMLELCRHRLPALRHLVYASSSSVYGGNTKTPFAVDDRTDRPVSLYAATKRADEILSQAYAHLYRIPQTGLRFFTVYGAWGRPDMAYYIFTDAITAGRPITLFNQGKMRRDFTYIDDIVQGVLAAMDRPPEDRNGASPHKIYNLGHNEPIELERFVTVLEDAIGLAATRRYGDMQPGDVVETYADISETTADLGWSPTTAIEDGLRSFVTWHREFHAGP